MSSPEPPSNIWACKKKSEAVLIWLCECTRISIQHPCCHSLNLLGHRMSSFLLQLTILEFTTRTLICNRKVIMSESNLQVPWNNYQFPLHPTHYPYNPSNHRTYFLLLKLLIIWSQDSYTEFLQESDGQRHAGVLGEIQACSQSPNEATRLPRDFHSAPMSPFSQPLEPLYILLLLLLIIGLNSYKKTMINDMWVC